MVQRRIGKIPEFGDLPPKSIQWGRRIQELVEELYGWVGDLVTRIDSVNLGLTTSIGALADQVTKQQQTIDLLNEMALQYQSETDLVYYGVSGGGWVDDVRPSVKIRSSTGRIRITWGAAANGGNILVTYSISGVVDRDDQIASGGGNVPLNCVMISGGASFTPTGSRSRVVTIPANTYVTVSIEIYMDDEYSATFAPWIMAEVVP